MIRPGPNLRQPPLHGVRWMLPFLAGWIVGCGDAAVGTSAPSAPAIRIAAASDLQVALPKLGAAFQALRGVEVQPTFLSSGVLARQIEQGAPFDLFLSADESYVARLARQGTIRANSVRNYAQGSLALVIHHAVKTPISTLADLARPEIKRIALANPETAPYGRAGKQAIQRSGLWESLQPRIVLAESVRQALHYAQNGDAEAALVGRAIADVPEVRVIEVDPGLYDPIVQAMGIVSDSPRRDQAEAFAAFILGDEGQSILRNQGFRATESREATP